MAFDLVWGFQWASRVRSQYTRKWALVVEALVFLWSLFLSALERPPAGAGDQQPGGPPSGA